MTLAATRAIKGLFYRCHYEDLGSWARPGTPNLTPPDPDIAFIRPCMGPVYRLYGPYMGYGPRGPDPYSTDTLRGSGVPARARDPNLTDDCTRIRGMGSRARDPAGRLSLGPGRLSLGPACICAWEGL